MFFVVVTVGGGERGKEGGRLVSGAGVSHGEREFYINIIYKSHSQYNCGSGCVNRHM